MSLGLKQLEKILKKARNQMLDEGITNQNLEDTLYATQEIIRIFAFRRNKEAEKILADLLRHQINGIKFLALYALWEAKQIGNDLDWEAEIKLQQFINNPRPVNQEIWAKVREIYNEVDTAQKEGKAEFN